MQFSEFVIANIRLYALRNEQRLSTHAVANFTRQELAEALRRVRSMGSGQEALKCREITAVEAICPVAR